MLQQRIATSKRPQPEQAAKTAAVQNQMQRHLQIQHQVGQAFEAQQIGAAVFGMTAMAQPLQLPLLAGAQATATPAEVGLLCLLYTSPSPRDVEESRMPSSA